MPRQNRSKCPFIHHPLNGCYILDMRSQDVEKAIYYCGGNYEKCEIYARRPGTKEKTEAQRAAVVQEEKPGFAGKTCGERR